MSACPGTSGFIGEFLTLMGIFQVQHLVSPSSRRRASILSAVYALWLYRRVIFGVLEKENLKAMLDLSVREKAILYPLIALTILFGVLSGAGLRCHGRVRRHAAVQLFRGDRGGPRRRRCRDGGKLIRGARVKCPPNCPLASP